MNTETVPQSFNAAVWADAFVSTVKENPNIPTDPATMVTWFANSIMRGYDEGMERAMEKARLQNAERDAYKARLEDSEKARSALFKRMAEAEAKLAVMEYAKVALEAQVATLNRLVNRPDPSLRFHVEAFLKAEAELAPPSVMDTHRANLRSTLNAGSPVPTPKKHWSIRRYSCGPEKVAELVAVYDNSTNSVVCNVPLEQAERIVDFCNNAIASRDIEWSVAITEAMKGFGKTNLSPTTPNDVVVLREQADAAVAAAKLTPPNLSMVRKRVLALRDCKCNASSGCKRAQWEAEVIAVFDELEGKS